MRIIVFKFLILMGIALSAPASIVAQDTSDFEISYDVLRSFSIYSINPEELEKASTLEDLYSHFKPSWIKEYLSIEMTAMQDGKRKKVFSNCDLLTSEQKELMSKVDAGTTIEVLMKYMPDNSLKHNDPKEFEFAFIVDPEKEASFPGGEAMLEKYLDKNIVQKVSESKFRRYNLTVVKFLVDEDGLVKNPEVTHSSNDEELDQYLVETICKMPRWEAAEYSDKTKVGQEFVLAIGDMGSCVVNLINVRREPQE